MIAKHEFSTKVGRKRAKYLRLLTDVSARVLLIMPSQRETIAKVAPACPHLRDVVDLSKKQGNITVKNSPGRNLHRLMNTLAFIGAIFKGLLSGMTLKDSVSTAYDQTLGQLHNWVVRTGIKTGMLGLPSREHFLSSIGETEESARGHAEAFVAAADKLVAEIEKLFVGIDMPRSDFTVAHLWGK